MVKTAANPGGLPKETFDDFQAQLAANRSEFYRAVAAGPFYNYNRPGAKPSEAIIQNWWRQGMMGGAKAHYDGIVAFSQTDFTADLKKISVPVLVMHSEDDQIVPYADAGPLSAKLLEERHAEDLQGFPARHADHAGRNHQRRPSRVHRELKARHSRDGLRAIQGTSPVSARLLPMLHRRRGHRGRGRMAHTTPGLCGGARHRQPDQGQRRHSPIVTHKLRGNISALEGSGGTVAVLTGPDGKVLIDAGIGVSRPQLTKALADLGADPITHLINTHWHFDHTDGNAWLNAAGAKIIAQENTRKYLSQVQRVEDWDYNFLALPQGGIPERSVRRGA